jgi:hypothetical protein
MLKFEHNNFSLLHVLNIAQIGGSFVVTVLLEIMTRGPLSLVSTSEELLDRKVAASV